MEIIGKPQLSQDRFLKKGDSDMDLIEDKIGAITMDELLKENLLILPQNPKEFERYFSDTGYEVELLVDLD